ncbi:hypothetical protein ACJMK2_012412 [Sinanodonta woodiana]|uniref:vitamin-K-epoxide reductase (warfarin-sensitive) n=1 Tax=Sinanodonta woodiana TaxID=1069815 RepID=A0ABD3V8D3_SINWO
MDEETGYLIINNALDRMLFNVFGFLVSLYSLNIEWKKEHNPMYKAYCDINEHMSCSRVLTSEYARGFGLVSILFGKNSALNIRNCTLGLFFYLFQILLGFSTSPTVASILYYSSIVSIVGCVYLAFILFFVLKDFCVVCIATYFINGAILYLNYSHKVAAQKGF